MDELKFPIRVLRLMVGSLRLIQHAVCGEMAMRDTDSASKLQMDNAGLIKR
jgi:hypothetical protein